jgi:ABC-type transporter Mla MlaB component
VADAALCVASQDFIKAEAILSDALQTPRENVELLSLAWLDLLNVLNRKTQYEIEAGALQQRFGTRAPSYRTATGMAYGTPRFTAKRVMGAPEAAQLGRTVLSAQDAKEQMVLSFVRLDSVDATAMPALAIALKRLNSFGKPFVLTGGVRLLDALESHFERHRMTLSHHGYDARMEALRLMNTPAPYNKLLAEYAAKFTQAAPAWQAPTAVFKTYTDKPLELQQHMQMTPLDGSEPSSSFGTSMQRGPSSIRPAPSSGRITLQLDDCLSAENADDTITTLESQAQDQRVVTVNCGTLLRVDFQAAVALINWLENCAERKIVVTLRDIGVLTEALLQTLGAEQFAKIERRVAEVDAAGKITTSADPAAQPR